MVKKKKKSNDFNKCFVCKIVIFCILLFWLDEIMGVCTVYAAGNPEVRDINLNQEGEIAGLTDPKQALGVDSDWSGNYLYFGEYKQGWFAGKDSVKWRVLDVNTTEYGRKDEPTILLLSDKVIGKVEFNFTSYQAEGEYYVGSGNPHYANEYAYSNIRKWLNSEDYEAYEESKYFEEGFYEGAFSLGE